MFQPMRNGVEEMDVTTTTNLTGGEGVISLFSKKIDNERAIVQLKLQGTFESINPRSVNSYTQIADFSSLDNKYKPTGSFYIDGSSFFSQVSATGEPIRYIIMISPIGVYAKQAISTDTTATTTTRNVMIYQNFFYLTNKLT